MFSSSYLGYVGPQSTSQQFLMMFLWLYGFWTLFFPDQDPLIWEKQSIKHHHWSIKPSTNIQTHPDYLRISLGSLSKTFFLCLYLIQKHSSIFRCDSHRLRFDLLKRSCRGFNDFWFNENCLATGVNEYNNYRLKAVHSYVIILHCTVNTL